jgi:hypothetical protein
VQDSQLLKNAGPDGRWLHLADSMKHVSARIERQYFASSTYRLLLQLLSVAICRRRAAMQRTVQNCARVSSSPLAGSPLLESLAKSSAENEDLQKQLQRQHTKAKQWKVRTLLQGSSFPRC